MRDNAKVQVFERADGKLGWRKRDGAGDIIASDGTQHEGVLSALMSAQEANPGVDRIEVILTDNGQGQYEVPLGADIPA